MGQRGGPNIPLDNINSYSDSLNTRSYAGTGNTISCLFSRRDFKKMQRFINWCFGDCAETYLVVERHDGDYLLVTILT